MPWELWDIIQEIAPDRIQPNPPSSGMLGESGVWGDSCDSCLIEEFIEEFSFLLASFIHWDSCSVCKFHLK